MLKLNLRIYGKHINYITPLLYCKINLAFLMLEWYNRISKCGDSPYFLLCLKLPRWIRKIMATSNTIQVIITGSAKGLQQAVKTAQDSIKGVVGSFDNVKNAAKNVGETALKAFANTAKVAAISAVTALAGIGTAAVKSFADYEQLVGGVETLFAQSSETVMEYARNAYKTAGLSANNYMETVTSFSASLLQGLGGDTAEAARIANVAVTDMADNANKMGTGIASIQDAYQGFAKQNYTMLDNLKLGYGGTASEMARLINDSGVLGDSMQVTAKTVNEVSFDKMIQAIHVVQERMGITGTTAKEAADTISGSVSTMRAAWQNMLTGIADDTQDFEQLVRNLVESVGNVFKNLVPTITVALNGITSMISSLAPIIVNALPGIVDTVIPSIIQATVSIMQAIIDALPKLFDSVVQAILQSLPVIIEGLMNLAQSIISALPNIVQTIVKALPQLLQTIVTGIMGIEDLITKPNNLKMILQAALELLMAIVDAIPQVIVAIIDALPQIIVNIVSFLLDPGTIGMLISAAVQLFFALVEAVPQILGSLLGAFGELFGTLFENLGPIVGEIFGGMGEWFAGVWETIQGIFGGAAEWFGGVFQGAVDVIHVPST